jgi:two-component system, cell cycle sensor histidine kinase and response regulator CckA
MKEVDQKIENWDQDPSLFRILIDCSNDAVYFVGPDGQILDCNQTATVATGYSREELVTMSVPDLQTELSEPKAWNNFKSKLMAKKTARFKGFHRRKDGRRFPVDVNSNYLALETGDYMIAIARDISERTRLEEELLQSRKLEAVGRLAGGIAHDFNNILTVIKGYTALLLDDSKPKDNTHWKALEIQEACDRATRLITQLLAFGRKSTHNPSVLNLNNTLLRMENMLDRALGDPIQLDLDLASPLANIYIDTVQLEQVILNLALNAKDAMPNSGRLLISTKSSPAAEFSNSSTDHIRLDVTDTGQGMSPEVLEKCFEPFYTTKERGKGSGLGLSTIYGIVAQSKGSIKITSVLQQGTSVKIYLPATKKKLPRQRPSPLDSNIKAKGDETILLVEDDNSVRELAALTLGKLGYKILQATNGKEGLEKYREYMGTIHLVITDVLMPQMGGVDMCRRILEIEPKQRYLFISGFVGEKGIPSELRTSRNFLQKPLKPSQFSLIIRANIEAKD